MEETTRVETLTPAEAAKYMGKSPEYVRALLRQGRTNWGNAAQGKTGQWNYLIIKNKFLQWLNVNN